MLCVCFVCIHFSRVSFTHNILVVLFIHYIYIHAPQRHVYMYTRAISEHSHWNKIMLKHMAVPFTPIRIPCLMNETVNNFSQQQQRRIAMPFRYQEQDFSTHYIFLFCKFMLRALYSLYKLHKLSRKTGLVYNHEKLFVLFSHNLESLTRVCFYHQLPHLITQI